MRSLFRWFIKQFQLIFISITLNTHHAIVLVAGMTIHHTPFDISHYSIIIINKLAFSHSPFSISWYLDLSVCHWAHTHTPQPWKITVCHVSKMQYSVLQNGVNVNIIDRLYGWDLLGDCTCKLHSCSDKGCCFSSVFWKTAWGNMPVCKKRDDWQLVY